MLRGSSPCQRVKYLLVGERGDHVLHLPVVGIELLQRCRQLNPQSPERPAPTVGNNNIHALTQLVGYGPLAGVKVTGTNRTPGISRAFR